MITLLWSSPPSGAWYGNKGGFIYHCQYSYVRHTVAANQHPREERWAWNSTCCVTVIIRLPGVCCGHVRSSVCHSVSRKYKLSTRRLNWLVLFGAHSLPPQHPWVPFKPPKELGMPDGGSWLSNLVGQRHVRYWQSKTARRESRPR